MKEKRIKLTFLTTPENANKLKAFNMMLENEINFNVMKDVSELAIKLSKKSNNEFVKTYKEVEFNKPANDKELSESKFGISAEDFLKTIGVSKKEEEPIEEAKEKVTIDYTEWQKEPAMRNIYNEINYDMSKGYVPLTSENRDFILDIAREPYMRLKQNICTPGYDINKTMTEIYNLWREINA